MHSTRVAKLRSSARRLLGTALLAAGLAAFAASASAATPPAQPAELQALEQQMSELTVTSERVSGKETISGKLPHKLAAPKSLSTEFSGEQSLSPEFANVTVKIAGRSLTVLQLGQTLYTHDPSIAAHDGGRPWVAESLSAKDGLFGSSPSLGGGGGGGGSAAPSPTPFKSDAELLKAGSEVRVLGASTVDGQATVGFAGTLTAGHLAESVFSKKQLAKLKHEHLKLKGSFEVFIANGVPVHTGIVLSIGKLRIGTSADVLAIDFPVTVPAPPPAAETISAAELLKLEKARLKRLLKKKKK
jgi:hypothetical protein